MEQNMALIRYPVIVDRGAHGFRVTIPDFPDIVGHGDTIAAATANAEAALHWHIAGLVESGDHIPAPSMMLDLQADPSFAGHQIGLVTASTALWRPEVVN
jgi:predicted RNase H-like HicB family nuclease